jgi:hypothetical protein
MSNKYPLFISPSGDKYWYNENGNYHRDDGPAIEFTSGTKMWHINGVNHREDGPAIMYSDGECQWYINGEYIHVKSQKEFEQYKVLIAFQ